MFKFSRWWGVAIFAALLIDPRAQAEEPIDKLIAQLSQAIPSGRQDAARQLALRGPAASAATETLIQALGDTQADMRLLAAYALGRVQTDPAKALAALVPVLADRDEHVRYSAQWSVAHISSAIPADLEPAQATQLAGVLARAIKEIRQREHQSRHLIAAEVALSRVEQMLPPKVITVIAAAPLPVAPPAAPPPSGPTPEQVQAEQMLARMVEATDRVGRYQLARRLANWDAYPDRLRELLLEKLARDSDPSVFYFTLQHWGRPGHELLFRLIESRLAAGPLTVQEEGLLAEFVPWSESARRLLFQLIIAPDSAVELRWSAAAALGRSPEMEPALLAQCLNFIEDQQQDLSLRGALVEAIAQLGAPAGSAETRLIALLESSSDVALRGTLVRALASIAPTSPAVVHALRTQLIHAQSDNPFFVDVVDAIGQLGPAAIVCQDELLRGLRFSDAFIRFKCVEALGRMGAGSPNTAQVLVTRLNDAQEEMMVRSAAVAALKNMGTVGLTTLASRIATAVVSGDQAAITNLLQALTSMQLGSNPLLLSQDKGVVERLVGDCLTVLSTDRYALSARTAAAGAVGSLGRDARTAWLKLVELCQPTEVESLRSACLLALAQIDRQAVAAQWQPFEQSDSILLRASAAFARHLAGDSRQGLSALVGLIDGSESDEILAQSIEDMGVGVRSQLVEIAAQTNIHPAARLIAYRIACQLPSPDWNRLLPLLDDPELGSALAACAEGPVQSMEGIECVLELLESQRLRPAAQARVAGLLSPDGLGAGEADQDWPGLTLQQPRAIESLVMRGQAMREAADHPLASEAAPAFDMPPLSPLGALPAMPTQAVPTHDFRSTGEAPKLVEVFYGTNRSRVAASQTQQTLAINVLATAGGGLLAMVICLFGFVRGGNRFSAMVALLAIAVAAPFGYQAAHQFAQEQYAAIGYDGTYQRHVEIGSCQVSIPPGHEPGQLESPSLLKLEFKQELDKHVVLTSIQPLDKPQFYERLQQRLDSDGKNMLVFIHGYNVSFEDAARRTAQMAHDLKFPGAPVFYSWPSQANWYGYATDQKNIELSIGQIKEFLVELAEKSGAETINLVAHSMGNVGLTQALREIDQKTPEPMFNQLVLAAPDIDADVFKERIAPAIVGKARHVTLYTSQTDLALIASRYFNHGPRVGDSAFGVPLLPGIETIDATSVDSSLIGHSYYGSNVTVLTDLGYVLSNQPATQRAWLQSVPKEPQPYWTFDVTKISQSGTATTR